MLSLNLKKSVTEGYPNHKIYKMGDFKVDWVPRLTVAKDSLGVAFSV